LDNKLKIFAESLFTNYETRMYRKEKDSFLDHCEEEFAKLGYDVIVKEDRNMFCMTSKNLVAGALDADILITAHYDTPGRNGFMLFLTPLTGMLLGSILFILAVIFLPQILAENIGGDFNWARHINNFFILIFLASIFLKNKHNHNDNTSGVLGVYKLAEFVSQNPELKARCAFVLFDHEEVLPGLLGSRAFAKWRRQNHPDKAEGMVINLDCIGIGDVLTVMTKESHDGWHSIAGFLKNKGFDVRKVCGGLIATSDHAPFINGVSLLFQKRSLLGPLFIQNIHSGRDKVCDLNQLERLCEAVYQYIDGSS